jgi:GT2 family glycosyltransferase
MTSIQTQSLGAVLVHYHTPELARVACQALRREARNAEIDLSLVIVDNGSTAAERQVLEAVATSEGARILASDVNLGYAGGINRGVAALAGAHYLLVANPDVWVLEGCLRPLIAALDAGAAIVGPAFFWDRAGGYLLPPTEKQSARAELERARAAHSEFWRRKALDSWRAHARRHWRAEAALHSFDLSGALLMFTAATWSTLGPWDESYRLYFEETDWLKRLEARGLGAVYQPQARALHLYAQSSVREPAAERFFAASQRRFRERFFGPDFVARLTKPGRRQAAPPELMVPICEPDAVWPALPDARWLEISPSPWLFPAAGRFLADGLRAGERLIPAELWPRLSPGRYFVSACSEDRTLATVSVERRNEP